MLRSRESITAPATFSEAHLWRAPSAQIDASEREIFAFTVTLAASGETRNSGWRA